MEHYQRFTEIYLPGQPGIKDNALFSQSVNKQISDFVHQNQVASYRIINCETQVLPSVVSAGSDKGYVMLIVYVAYSH